MRGLFFTFRAGARDAATGVRDVTSASNALRSECTWSTALRAPLYMR
jgi:hypothetical protein